MSFKDRVRHLQPKVIRLPFKQLDPDRIIPDGPAATIMILPIVRIERPEWITPASNPALRQKPAKPKRKPMTPRHKLKSLIRPVRTVLFAGAVAGILAARLSVAHADPLPEYTLRLSPQEVELIGTAILELPMRVAQPLQAKLRAQAAEQERAAAKPAPKADDQGSKEKAPE